MRLWLSIISVLLSLSVSAQITNGYIHPSLNHSLERSLRAKDTLINTALKPLNRSQLKTYGNIMENAAFEDLWDQDFELKSNLSLYPLLELQGGYELGNHQNKAVLNSSIGAGFDYDHDKWHINLNYMFGYWQTNRHMQIYTDSNEIIPSMGYAIPLGDNYASHSVLGSVSFTPNQFFTFELGKNKHFIGHGHRSLILSDNANSHPYFKIDTKFWRVRYTNIYSWMQDITTANGDPSKYINKFSTAHYLDWKVTKSWSIGIYESIIWQAKDTLLNRQFDINYLNPIIFYRPVEFAQGSADNAIMGLNTLVKINKNHHIYAQFVIDEFLLDAIQADIKHFFNPEDTTIEHGWWANKYAFQIGYKYFDVAQIEGLDFQTEINLVRPFMFSHGSTLQNYAHFNQSMTHPRGANFYEWVNFIRYQKGNWRFSNQFIWSIYGTDYDEVSYGGDLYESYRNREGTYGHKIGQGLKNALVFNDLSASYIINSKINLQGKIGYMMRHNYNRLFQDNANYFYLGLSTQLWSRNYDY